MIIPGNDCQIHGVFVALIKKQQKIILLVLGVVPLTRQEKANRMTFMVSSMNQNSS